MKTNLAKPPEPKPDLEATTGGVDSRTLEALRILVELCLRWKKRLDQSRDLGLHDDGGQT